MTEGGGLLTTDILRLNVTCPSFVTVAAPLSYNKEVTLYIGGKSVWGQYNFPAFQPTFEQCNFITSYNLTSTNTAENGILHKNNTMNSFGLIKEIPEMKIVYGVYHRCNRVPCTA
jgi:hypothetical protein